ncbi:ABC transporter permease [Notoacmeibacter sp. MSK16QG-6]|uniref:ABC transporter permease n=1 Tax=Notoacmeibacter sp. MSK16QG-6 TaxID=2957982 RepID=UPI00209E8EEC|nr:ABC transporter permease [Notoacmeibacter sp. MSK16QG-6]MCP1198191.1 ABC transporter permease [Notoacmeibacter sp. MSK16QG-6]
MTNTLPPWVNYVLLPAINLLVAFIVSGLVVVAVGENPFKAAWLMIDGAFGSGRGIGFTLFYATNFIFTGLSVAVAIHCGLFNIGSEGQALIGGLGVALACLWLGAYVPWWLVLPVAIVMGAGFGAAWGFLPGYLQAVRGSHVVITTIMFNFIAASLMNWLLVDWLRPAGQMGPETAVFADGGWLPKLTGLLNLFGADIRNTPLNLSFFVALICCLLVWVLIWRTRFGYSIRTMGLSPSAAKYAGIRPARTVIIAMMISGGLAGLMSLNPVMGDLHRLTLDIVQGAGFVGIAVALMGRNHPVGIVLAAILFGMLYQGGAELAFDMPTITRDMIVVIQGLVILFAGALEHMFRPQLTRFFLAMHRRGVSPEAEGAA